MDQQPSHIELETVRQDFHDHETPEKFRDGWVYLDLRIIREVDSDGSFEDSPRYILGKPKKKP